MHETCDCTCGTANINNCFGIKENGKFVKFATKKQSYNSFKWNWKKHYNSMFPTYKLAKKWSGNDRAISWLRNVTLFYYQYQNEVPNVPYRAQRRN